jgi:hypothetical protein
VATNRFFFTPGYYYRPNQLKNMTCLLGNTETRTVYRNFDLANLNVNLSDRTHMLYNRYLCYSRFLPPEEKRYFAHLATNTLAAAPGSAEDEKGAFNIFPLSLTTEEMSKPTSSTLGKNMRLFFLISCVERLFFLSHDPCVCLLAGVVKTSPLKLEIQFEPVPENQWYLIQTYVNTCKIDFSGSKTNQEVTFDYL